MTGTAMYGPAPSTAADRAPTPAPAWVYLLRCADGSLYGGWTNDLARRLKAHRSGKGGARYTKSHGRASVQLAYAEKCADKNTDNNGFCDAFSDTKTAGTTASCTYSCGCL